MYLKLAFAINLSISLQAMTVEEKVGALFVIPICPKRGEEHVRDVEELFEKYHISSVIVKQATPDEQKGMLDRLGRNMFVFQDAEWGLGMRMDGDVLSFPKNGFLEGAESDLLYRMGKEIARELRIVGCHVNLAPVCDVNSNPNNIIIGTRSFGSDPNLVAAHATAFASGLQAGGVMACGKHFPGHGDVEIDSHVALPTVGKTREELRSLEFIPFQAVIDSGIGCIMTGHLNTPHIDAIEILRDEMGFEGLIISDAMNMGAVKEGDALRYLEQGHDMLLYGDHIAPKVDTILHELIPQAYEAILQAVLRGELTIDDKVERIALAKQRWLKPRENGALNTEEALALLQELRAL